MKELEIKGHFTIVENEILDLLPLIGLSKRELEFMLVAVRLLNGFDKEKDRIPLSQLAILTRMSKANCSRTVKSLIKKKMWYKSDNLIGINRDISQWEGVANLATYKGLPKWHTGVAKIGKKGVANLAPSKEKEKEIIQRKVLSKSQREKKKKEYKTGLAMMKEAVKRSQERKRKSN